MSRTHSLIVTAIISASVVFGPTAIAKKKGARKKQEQEQKQADERRPVRPGDYARWESLRPGEAISRDGRWLTYTVARVDKEHSLHLLDLQSEKNNEPALTIKQGERPVFTKDSQWLAITIGKSPADIKKAQKAAAASGGRPAAPPSGGRTVKLRWLEDGETTEIKDVRALDFSDDSRFAAIEVGGTSASKALVVRNLHKGTDTTFGNVTKHAWSDRGSLLAMVVDSPTISNSLQVFDPQKGVLRTLDSGDQEYANLSWRKDSMDLVVMREMKHAVKEDVSHVLLAWRDLDKTKFKGKAKAKGKAMVFEHAEEESFPEEMYIASGTLTWSKSGDAVLVDLLEWENKPKSLEKSEAKPEADTKPPAVKTQPNPQPEPRPKQKKKQKKKQRKQPPEPQDSKSETAASKEQKPGKSLRESLETESNVEVWHAKDVDIMPLQKKQAGSRKNPKRRAIWWPEDGVFVQLGNELTERVDLLRSEQHAIGLDHTPHVRTGMFGPKLSDVYLIDTSSGERERVLKEIEYLLTPSPDGEFLLYIHKANVWSYEVQGGKRRNLTGKLKTHFTNQQDDSLAVEKSPFSSGQWLADSSAVLLYDRFNIWRIAPDGSAASRLTDGDADMVRHRLSRANMGAKDDGLLDPDKEVYIALYGDRSKKSGYARMRLDGTSKTGKPRVERLIWEDRAVHSLIKPEENDEVYLFKREAADDSPDLFVAGPDLRDAQQLSETNPFQKQFLWGRSELVDYVNDNGVKLQGALTYPAGYQPGKKYPMVVYIYERLSQNLHRYVTPTETHPYNSTVFSAEGYFVFMPDIVYRRQEPGVSAVECIVPAVKAVLETGMVDADRVALVGHSWGAYQTAFTVTQTDLFAAGVAGAPLTDMMSMSVQVYWNSGNTNARIFHVSQGRMDTPFWRDVDNYVRNSPIHGMDKLNTPLLVTFGDKDGAVDFGQGVQMYNAARLANKEDFVMLVYPGENHGLRREENSVDYHYRILEWLAHYLKGETAPKWITEGKSFLEREKEKEDKKKAKAKENEKKGAPKPK